MKEDYQKAFKKITLFLLLNTVLFNRQDYQKQKGPVTIQVTKQVPKNSFISCLLSDHVWWCNINRFLSYSKIYICKFMQANLFRFHLPFEIWKVWKGREKLQKFEYLGNEKSFLYEIKNIFIVFEDLSFDQKIKIW